MMNRAREKRAASLPAAGFSGKPMVAIVGRPNIGKSTLFNKLAGRKLAIVEDIPGVTRDRHYADASALGREFVLIDTGGFDPESDDPMQEGIASQVEMAIEECDILIGMLSAADEAIEADRLAVRMLERSGKPVLYLANKADNPRLEMEAMSHYELGIDDVLPISALHSRGIGELEERLCELLPPTPTEFERPADGIPRVALIGRPNAGKSSLTNRMLGSDQQLVDDRPGTTVDSVDTLVERAGTRVIFTDTAGIRRKRAVKKVKGIEALGVYHSIRALERSDVAVLMIDGHLGPGEQDAKIAGLAVDRGRALILALNKTDLMTREEISKAKTRTREILAFAPWAQMVTVSAKTGRGVDTLVKTVGKTMVEFGRRVATAELNRFFNDVLEENPPPTMNSRPVRLYFITQAQTNPPTFIVSTNHPDAIHFSYQRYVINQIRKKFGFEGVPVRVRYRSKNNRKRI